MFHGLTIADGVDVPDDVLAPLQSYASGHATDQVATATMTLWHGSDTFTDAFVLIRVSGRWWIANKVYQRH